MNLGHTISLEIFEEHEEVTYYTVRLQGDSFSETEKFFRSFMNDRKFKEDIQVISRKLERIGRSGCQERHVRHAGKMHDDVCALPEYHIGCKLRLYAIRVSEKIVILGNGGYKTTRTYNEDSFLNDCVEMLQQVDYNLKKGIRKTKINITNNKIKGNLTFQI